MVVNPQHEPAELPLLIVANHVHAIAVSSMIAVITFGLSAAFELDGLHSPVGWVLVSGAVGFSTVPILLKKRGDRAASVLVPVVGMLTLSAMVILEGGLRSEAMYWLAPDAQPNGPQQRWSSRRA